jgi:hypothetical protein
LLIISQVFSEFEASAPNPLKRAISICSDFRVNRVWNPSNQSEARLVWNRSLAHCSVLEISTQPRLVCQHTSVPKWGKLRGGERSTILNAISPQRKDKISNQSIVWTLPTDQTWISFDRA